MTIKAGTHWGGSYSRFTFNEALRYYAMLKEKEVPVLDDEFNVLQDILLTALRRSIADVAGNGSPNDGFLVVGTGASNNFTIRGGNDTVDGAGVIFVAGLRLILPSDTTYLLQEIEPPALTTPGGDRTDEVYLDIWLDEIGPDDDPNIVDPTLSVETSRRLQLFWQVKVAEGGTTPAAYTDENEIPHYTYRIAILSRTATAAINAGMVTDTRGVINPQAFYLGQAGTAIPLMAGEAAVGTSLKFARQDHRHPTDTSRAPLASPAFTGNPTAPTQAADSNNTRIATTAFVVGQAGSAAPLMDGTAAVGTSLRYARQDHRHPTDTSLAPLASPAFTGNPTAPTQAADSNNTRIATTAFVVGQAGSAAPLMDGTAEVGTSLRYARQDHRHPTDTSLVPTSRTLTAGNGMTGGGDLSANRSFAVGAGDGISVSSSAVELDTSHTRNVAHSAVSILAGNGLTGGGTIAASRTLNVGAGPGIQVTTTAVQLDYAESAELSADQGLNVIFNPGFGVHPRLFWLVLRCIQDEHGISAGEEVFVASGFSGGARGPQISTAGTVSMRVRTGDGGPIRVLTPSGNNPGITASRWRLVGRCIR